jgi:hypothetical protein
MIAVRDRRDAWVGLSPDLKTITSEPTVGKGNTIYESEMALFFECMQCARKVLDTGRHRQRRDITTWQPSGPSAIERLAAGHAATA